MIKISFEYTLVNTAIIKVEPKITKDASTTDLEICLAGAIKEWTIDSVEKSGLVKEAGINDILNNIGKT